MHLIERYHATCTTPNILVLCGHVGKYCALSVVNSGTFVAIVAG